MDFWLVLFTLRFELFHSDDSFKNIIFSQVVLKIKNEETCRVPMNKFVKLLYGYAIIDSGKATMS